jgi:hypothetical protein
MMAKRERHAAGKRLVSIGQTIRKTRTKVSIAAAASG